MNSTMHFRDKEYTVIMVDHESIIADKEIGQNLLGTNHIHLNYRCIFDVKEYRLFLRSFELVCKAGYRATVQKVSANEYSNNQQPFDSQLMIPNAYTGSILIGRDEVLFGIHTSTSSLPCYNYKEVVELIFSQGILVTSIDHSRAMRRIRINLKYGYRNLRKKKDVRCIKRFLNELFTGEYRNQIAL